jgi:hypothetical protein
MRQFLDRAAMTFAGGAFGALVNSLAIWAAGACHLTARLGVDIAPAMTPPWLYPRIVWGGLWGFLFLLPVLASRWWLRGIVLSLAPSAFQLLYVFPRAAGHGVLGLDLGALTPVFVLAANALWGLSAAWLLRMTGRG